MSSGETWGIRILGDFALLRDGEVARRFGSRREDELLAYLALDASVPKLRDAIIQAIWPGVEPSHSRKHLSFSLYMLKKQFAAVGLADAIQPIRRTGLVLASGLVVDAQVFSATIASAAGSENEAERLDRALSLYGGPLLPTCDAVWVEPHRAQFAELYELALARMTERAGATKIHESIARGVSSSAWGGASAAPTLPAHVDAWGPSDEELLALASEAEEGLSSEDPSEWLERIRAAYPRIETLLARGAASSQPQRALAVAGRIWRYWYLTHQVASGSNWLQRLIGDEAIGTKADRARAYHALGTLLIVDGLADAGAKHLARALDLWREADDPTGLLKTLISLGMAYQQQHETERASVYYDQSIAIARILGDRRQLDGTLHNRATLAQTMEEYELALSLLQERLALLPSDAAVERATALVGIACAQQGRGDYTAAKDAATKALALIKGTDQPRVATICHQVLGRVAYLAEELDEAAIQFRIAGEEARQTRQLRHVGTSMAYLALTMWKQGDVVAATKTFDEGMNLLGAAGAAGEEKRFQREWDKAREGAPTDPVNAAAAD